MSKRFTVGMFGTDDICELHVAAVKALPDLEMLGVADVERKRAQANAEKWGAIAFDSLDQMIEAGANVIHVLTPPATRAKYAKAALEKGCHVIVEAPVAESEKDALEIARLAQKKGLVASVNHSQLFDPQVKRALDSVRAGQIGQVVSVDIVRSAEYPPYEGGPLPAWYRDAGYPFRDLGVHCLYLIQELLGPIEDVDATWQSTGSDPNLAFDDWHATVRCQHGLGQLQLGFGTGARPQSQLIIHGTTGVLRIDLLAAAPGPFDLLAMVQGKLSAFAATLGVHRLIKREAQAHLGLRELVADFYKRLAAGEEPPVSVVDAAKVVRWVDKVARAADEDQSQRLARFKLAERVPFLVTGAAGNLGRATVQRLLEQGHRVRVLVRRMPASQQDGVEYCIGNLGDPEAVDRAVRGVETVIHVGAATKGGWPEHKVGTVMGTQHVVDACKKHRVKQLVHISSMSVVDWAGSADNGAVSETTNLEPRPDERGAYTRAKLEAETIVREAAKSGLPAVILRPGQIFGGGIPLINGAVAREAGGRWLVLGDGKLELPLVYIDDVVDAITNAVDKRLTQGEVIQIIDPEHMTQEEVLAAAGGNKPVVRVPRPVVFALGKLSEVPLGVVGKQSPIGLYRLQSALARLHYESDLAQKVLGWRPRVGVREGMRRVM